MVGETDNQPTEWRLPLGSWETRISSLGTHRGGTRKGHPDFFPPRPRKPELSFWLVAYVYHVVTVICAFESALIDMVFWGPSTLWSELPKCMDKEVVTERRSSLRKSKQLLSGAPGPSSPDFISLFSFYSPLAKEVGPTAGPYFSKHGWWHAGFLGPYLHYVKEGSIWK